MHLWLFWGTPNQPNHKNASTGLLYVVPVQSHYSPILLLLISNLHHTKEITNLCIRVWLKLQIDVQGASLTNRLLLGQIQHLLYWLTQYLTPTAARSLFYVASSNDQCSLFCARPTLCLTVEDVTSLAEGSWSHIHRKNIAYSCVIDTFCLCRLFSDPGKYYYHYYHSMCCIFPLLVCRREITFIDTTGYRHRRYYRYRFLS